MNSNHVLVRALQAISLLAAATIADAQSLTGVVTSPTGVPLPGINILLSNGGTGGTTNASGQFNITGLRNRVYSTVDFGAPQGQPWAGIELLNVNVNGVTNLGTVIMQQGFVVSGTVTSQTGTGAVGGNMNVYDTNGTKRYTPNDAILPGGTFSIVVPPGYNRVRAMPVVGSGLVPKDWELQNVTAPVSLTGVLERGYTLTGTIVDDVSGVPIAGTKLKPVVQQTGDLIGQATDVVNAFGQFTLFMPFGVSDIEIQPPVTIAPTQAYVPPLLIGVVTTGPTNMGQIRVKRGVRVSGTVNGPGGPIQGADIDFLLNGHKLFTPRDNTGAAGTFTCVVPTGTYVVTAQPNVASGLAGSSWGTRTFTADTNLGLLTCQPGVSLSGHILGPNGAEVGGDIDVLDPVTNLPIVIAGDHTNATGAFSTIVPPGTWTIRATSPQGSFGAPLIVPNLSITTTTVRDFVLPRKQVMLDVTSFFTWTQPVGATIPMRFTFTNPGPATVPVLFDLFVQYPSGATTPVLTGFPLDLPPITLALGPLFIPIPPIPASELGLPIRYVARYRSRPSGALLDEAYATFVAK